VQKRPAVNRFDSFLTFFSFFGHKKRRIHANAPFLTTIDFADDAVAEI
jgi:hypothetical protein